ncbi:MAG: hypothetical protein KIT84_05670 [Labilithrix sp.]|nr:hypothetical protein [Labilithrix sp.]
MVLGLAVLLGACAAQADGTASEESNVSAAAATEGGRSIAACNGSKRCEHALVLSALFASELRLVDPYPEQNAEKPLAREVAAEWLAMENDGRIRLEIVPIANGRHEVFVGLASGHETNEDEGDAAAMLFKFTLDGSRIVESEVVGHFAG